MVASISIESFSKSDRAIDFVSVLKSISDFVVALSGMALTTDLGVILYFSLYWICFLRLLSVSASALFIESASRRRSYRTDTARPRPSRRPSE